MNKAVIVLGTLSLAVVGGYLYFKSKATKPKDSSAVGRDTNTTASGATLTNQQIDAIKSNVASGNTSVPTGIVLTTPEQVLQVVNIASQQTQANADTQAIVTQITSLRSSLNSLVNPSPFNLFTSEYFAYQNQRSSILLNIQTLTNKLNALGYKEVDGKAVKIV